MAMMKRLFVVVLMMALLLAGCSTNTSTEADGTTASVDAVAVVNDEAISVDTFEILYSIYANAYKQAYGDDVLERVYDDVAFGDILKEDIYNLLIQDALIADYVDGTGYEVDAAEVATNLEELKASLEEDTETLALYDSLGVDDAFLEDQIISGLLRTEFSNLINSEIEADTDRLEDMYENYAVQVSASHILVEDDLTATLVLEKLDAGEDFAALAEEYSQDPGSASAGGSLGYFARGVMVPEFEDVAFSLGVGEVSSAVESDYGFHIIKVDDIKTINSMVADGESEDVINTYKAQIASDLYEEYYTDKLDALEAEATIEEYYEKVADFEPVEVTTDSESSEGETTDTESTDTESTDAESTDAESTDTDTTEDSTSN